MNEYSAPIVIVLSSRGGQYPAPTVAHHEALVRAPTRADLMLARMRRRAMRVLGAGTRCWGGRCSKQGRGWHGAAAGADRVAPGSRLPHEAPIPSPAESLGLCPVPTSDLASSNAHPGGSRWLTRAGLSSSWLLATAWRCGVRVRRAESHTLTHIHSY